MNFLLKRMSVVTVFENFVVNRKHKTNEIAMGKTTLINLHNFERNDPLNALIPGSSKLKV